MSKIKLKYIPHGVSEKFFFPITTAHPEYLALQEFKKHLYKGKEYDFTLLYNARNIRRKSVPDLMLAWKLFIDNLPEGAENKCALVMHTQVVDENGTDLQAVHEMLFGNSKKYNVIFDENKYPSNIMNLLYNATDGTILISSNEGFGLSLAEARMCGKMIIANSTGGMVDQMRFEDDEGKWIEYTPEFPSNHFGTYKECGEWAIPVFPSNVSMIGSVPTPYITDDRCDFRDVAKAIREMYDLGPEERKRRGEKGYEWVMSDESMMSARWMCKNIIDGIDETLEKWQPRHRFELIQLETPKQPKHYSDTPLVY